MTVLEKYGLWCAKAVEDDDLVKELERMKDDEKAMEDAFYKDLEFGTGGLRGVIGAGTNRMNIYTVRKASQGYSNYLNANFKSPSVAIAYDSRIKSDLFSKTAAGVFAANGIKVLIYPKLMPTPSLSFAVRHHGTSGGIVVTASHNPAKYNGYKVYGPDGCQITTEGAKEILKCINEIDIFNGVKTMDFDEGIRNKSIEYIPSSTTDAFIEAVSNESLIKNGGFDKSVSIVYTPLHGAGLECVTRCLKENGYTDIKVVEKQAVPDGNFPTCPYPNPEIREALELGLEKCRETGSDLLIATDPDSDRVGIAVRNGRGEYELLTGNEVGMLLLVYIAERRREINMMPKNPVMVKTIVTIDLAKRIAASYGVETREVLTGFKFIGEQIGLLEKEGHPERYILGFEESYGYLSGTYVRDKDAVNGALMIADMFVYFRSKGLSLLQRLEMIYSEFGYCLNTLHNYGFEGIKGFDTMQSVMKRLRNLKIDSILDRHIDSIGDYKLGLIHTRACTDIPTGLPSSDVLKFILEGDISFVVRPSGTEPKLKLYLSVSAPTKKEAVEIESRLKTEIEGLMGI